MDQPLYQKRVNHVDSQTQFQVFYDADSEYSLFHGQLLEFESEEDKESYLEPFRNGELACYGVVMQKPCKCCAMWSDIDSIWGIHARSAEEAFEVALSDHFNLEAVV